MIDKELLDILICPKCKGNIKLHSNEKYIICTNCDLAYYIDENMPDWAKPTVQKLIDKGALKENEKGELLLTNAMLRIFVANDRMGIYDKV